MSARQYEISATVYDKRGRVLGTGKNDYSKTHPKQYHYAKMAGLPEKFYLHAEMLAIIRALKTGKVPYKIVVSRYDKNGRPMNAEPCPICKLFIKEVGISVIEHTF